MIARPNPDHDEPQALPRSCQPVTLPLAEAAEAIPLDPGQRRPPPV